MDVIRRWLLPLLLILSVGAAASAPAAGQAPAAAAAATERGGSRALRAWWADQRWRYPTNEAAERAYRALVQSESPWPEWHQVTPVTLPVGLRFQMALSPGQGTDRPGGFGTFDRIPNVEYVRMQLAVKMAWKPAIDRVVTYEITAPLPADVGTVGPQIDGPVDRYLPGGGSQFQMTVPAPERIRHLRVVEVRQIR
jgi:hypothetical protein